jgi:hypothetical protein
MGQPASPRNKGKRQPLARLIEPCPELPHFGRVRRHGTNRLSRRCRQPEIRELDDVFSAYLAGVREPEARAAGCAAARTSSASE